MNNGDNKVRYSLEQLLTDKSPMELSKGCKVIDDYAGYKYYVFDDGTIIEQDWAGTVRSIDPSVRYGGIKLVRKIIPLANAERTIYNVELVRECDRAKWFIQSIPERVADGQISADLGEHFINEVFKAARISDEVKFVSYAGHSNGYIYHSIRLDSERIRPVPVHMIVATVFNGFAMSDLNLVHFLMDHKMNETYFVVNHQNSFKLDNDAGNLEWVTSKLNSMHGNFMAAGSSVQQYEGKKLGFKFVEFTNKGGDRTGKYYACETRISAYDVYVIVKKNYEDLKAKSND